MGLLSWLFPSPEDRVQRARKMMEADRPDEARLELLEVDHPEAEGLLKQAESVLARRNLDVAVEYARAGDDYRAHQHIELADRFHHGGQEEAFREARRQMREIRAQRSEALAREKEQREARLTQVDPLGLAGGPSLLDPVAPPGMLDPDREELEQRLALLVENYPEKLRPGVRRLGVDFARAVLALEDGRADRALQELLGLADEEPLVLWERARAAHALGDPASAAASLREFAQHAGGHFPMGRLHSGTYLAQLLTESGDPHGALRVLREVRRKHPSEGGFLFAQLLAITGALEEAEKATRALIKTSPKAMPLYGLLARIRLKADHRSEAMRALEAGLEATHCAPGKCGYQAPDLDANRLLATLYLEDGIQTERALELAGVAASLVQQPTVEDAYLHVLAARARNEVGAGDLARQLAGQMPEADPRRARLLA